MNKKGSRSIISTCFTLMMVLLLAFPVRVFAQDQVPTPTPDPVVVEPTVAPTDLVAATEGPIGPLADASAIPAEPTPVQTEVPAEPSVLSTGVPVGALAEATEVVAEPSPVVTEVVTETPTVVEPVVIAEVVTTLQEQNATLVGADGSPIPLASAEAAEALADPDPYIVRGTITYRFLSNCAAYLPNTPTSICTVSTTPIQAAVTFANDGEVVQIETGTFREQIIIEKNITLQGVVGGTTIAFPTTYATSPVYNQGGISFHSLIYINNAIVNLLGLTIDGENKTDSHTLAGITFNNSTGSVQQSVIKNFTNHGSGTGDGVGINAIDSDITIVNGTSFSNNDDNTRNHDSQITFDSNKITFCHVQTGQNGKEYETITTSISGYESGHGDHVNDYIGVCIVPCAVGYELVHIHPKDLCLAVCETGKTRDGNGDCQWIPCTNGATNPPTCNACPSGKELVNGQCVNVCTTGHTRVNGVCVDNCTNGATDPGTCTTCAVGYELVHVHPNNVCLPVCTAGHTRVNGVCVDNCTNGATNPPSCTTCTTGHTLVNGVCVDNCTNGATNPPTCDACSCGHELVNGFCVDVCTSGHTRVDGVCVNNCTNGATNPPTCTTCTTGHELVNGQCVNVCTTGHTRVNGVCVDNCTNGATNPPTCTITGCMDPAANNYNADATTAGTCTYTGCMDPAANNYNADATTAGTCTYTGCMDPAANNYNADATTAGTCTYTGCMDPAANNYNADATTAGTCTYTGCMDPAANNYNADATTAGTCTYTGCMDPAANNYNADATTAGTCTYTGCMDPAANNYNADATTAGTCTYKITPPPPIVTAPLIIPVTGGNDLITAGIGHTCAITPLTGLRCWGQNDTGQLGDGKNANSDVPVDVFGMEGKGVIALVSGTKHTCALTSGGEVLCWGLNYSGQLGNGTTTNSNVPVKVNGLEGTIISISAGENFTCAINSANKTMCWGNNSAGQFANGNTTNSSVPVVANLGTDVKLVSGGQNELQGVTLAGAIQFWSNQPAIPVTGLTNDVALVSADRFADGGCAMTTAGKVECWGSITGTGIGGGQTDQPLATGEGHGCTVTDKGLVCWGVNGNGQLGNGTLTGSETPVAVTGIKGVIDLAAGFKHTCAIVDTETIKCWGDNTYGQLGNGSTTESPLPVIVE